MTIITLYKQGESQRKIARLVGHDRKTVRRIIKLYNGSFPLDFFVKPFDRKIQRIGTYL